jgi:outer membrane receptor protein involved in Fe transport
MRRAIATALLTTTMLSAVPLVVHAQTTAKPAQKPDSDSTEVIVTAQKRAEKLSSVPISIEVLSTRKLDQLNIANVNDYIALLPSVSYQNSPYQGSSLYFRGVASGGDGNHSGSEPSAGVYLDEQPVTTIGGPLDVHIYDMARIESLAGPQGTLYGASSEAGTIRLITNKPDLTSAYGRFDVDGDAVEHGAAGGKIEAMYNLPLSDRMAVRLVGWSEHDAGYIDNILGSRTFTAVSGGSPITVTNAASVKKDFNDSDIYGGRAALKIDLDDNWTALVQAMGQDNRTRGSAGYDPSLGDLKAEVFYPDESHDRFYQAALTLTGKVANIDVTYAGAYMERKLDAISDYTDYAEAYDQLYSGVGGIANYFAFQDNNGNTIDPRQYIVQNDKFTKWSHELRFATPADQPLRFVGGVFVERQTHAILQDYLVPNLATDLSVTGWPGTLWLTDQMRIDRDNAVFGELSYDITPTLTATVGGRAFTYDNSLIGFFGMGDNPNYVNGNGAPPNAAYASSGQRRCFTTNTYGAINPVDPTGTVLPGTVAGSPCTDLGTQNADGSISPKRAKGHGFTPKFNLTWKATPDLMLYTTWSEGFRPGGINRRGTVPPYAPDYLTNAEIGWKASFLGRRLHWNGAIYDQNWKHFQYSFLGANSFTEVHNGPGARIRGLESDVTWQVTDRLALSASGAYTDARTTSNLCGYEGDSDPNCAGAVTTYETLYTTGSPVLTPSTSQDFVSAPKGTRLPITPRVKLSATARYTWEMGKYKPYWQLQLSNQSSASSDIRTQAIEVGTFALVDPAALLGKLKGYTSVNLAVGADWDQWTGEVYVDNLTDARGQLGRYNECGSCYMRSYIITNRPTTFGVRLGRKF